MSYASAREIGLSEIPVIDASERVEAVGAAIRRASEEVGFFYVRNHGIPDAAIGRAVAAAQNFFQAPAAQKAAVGINHLHRGFLGIGQAKMYRSARIDLKESFVWGLELGPDDPDVAAGQKLRGPNVWPGFVPGFREAVYGYYEQVMQCGDRLLRALAAGLELDPAFFASRYRKPLARGSIIYYPPQPPDLGQDQFGVAPHTDYGGITLLWQDQNGGLQVRSRRDEWVTAHPIEGTLVINVGDLLARWTNDRFRSTPHRVVNASGRARFSMAVFYDPDYGTVIDPAEIAGGRAAAKHPPVRCGDYIVDRFDKAFAYRK